MQGIRNTAPQHERAALYYGQRPYRQRKRDRSKYHITGESRTSRMVAQAKARAVVRLREHIVAGRLPKVSDETLRRYVRQHTVKELNTILASLNAGKRK